jgi:hypothetical protein
MHKQLVYAVWWGQMYARGTRCDSGSAKAGTISKSVDCVKPSTAR